MIERVIDDVLAHALLAVPLQVDDRGEALELHTRRLELESLELVGVDLQGEVLDLVVARHGAAHYRPPELGPRPDVTPPAAGGRRRRRPKRRRRKGMAEELSADAGAGLKALGLNCTLKKSPEKSHTEALMNRVLELLGEHGVETELLRPVDYDIKFGVSSDEGDGDQWPELLEKFKAADILLMGMSIWFGVRASVCQMVIERLDGTYNERNEVGQYPLYNKVAGVVVTGRRSRVRRVGALQHDPSRLRRPAQRRHLLGRRCGARAAPTSMRAARSTPTRNGRARGALTTCCRSSPRIAARQHGVVSLIRAIDALLPVRGNKASNRPLGAPSRCPSLITRRRAGPGVCNGGDGGDCQSRAWRARGRRGGAGRRRGRAHRRGHQGDGGERGDR